MATNGEFAIYVRGLRKSYGAFEAVKGIDFEVRPGEVFGLLGPNGAGKTSTVEILEGLRPRTAGDVKVLDFDPDRQKQRLKDRIGVCLQATNLPDKITVREALNLFGAFYSRTVDGEALLLSAGKGCVIGILFVPKLEALEQPFAIDRARIKGAE